MRPLAHHLGEESLAPLLLLGSGGGLSLLVAIGRARLAAARAKLTRAREGRDHPRLPADDPPRQGA
jgi:hypothetical protein